MPLSLFRRMPLGLINLRMDIIMMMKMLMEPMDKKAMPIISFLPPKELACEITKSFSEEKRLESQLFSMSTRYRPRSSTALSTMAHSFLSLLEGDTLIQTMNLSG